MPRLLSPGAVGTLLIALAAPRAAAQQPLTLERAVAIARDSAPAAQAALGTQALLVGDARVGAQWANPSVEFRRENIGAPIPYDDFITLTLPVSLTGRRWALRDALGAARLRAQAESLSVARDLEFQVARAWWSAWVAQRTALAQETQATRLAELARFDSLRASEGVVAEAAALRTRLEAQRAAVAAAQASAERARSRGALAALLGRDEASTLLLADAARVALPPTPSDSAAVATALAARPDVRAATAAAEQADRRAAAERRGALPDVGLSGGYKGTGGFATSQLGLIITPPLLNANGGARERALGEWLLADADRRATLLRATHEVRAARAAVEAMDAATRGMDGDAEQRAELVAAAAESAYREGAATLTETLEALRAVTDLRVAAIRAVADRSLTRLELRRAMGVPAVEDQ